MNIPTTYGELVPLGGGEVIPLFKPHLLVGRRESCDVVLRFSNVSAHHCELGLFSGYWMVKDLESRNGVRVNGCRELKACLRPGDILSIATHRYEVQYSPTDLGAVGPPPYEEVSDLFEVPLLERAGLSKEPRPAPPPKAQPPKAQPLKAQPPKAAAPPKAPPSKFAPTLPPGNMPISPTASSSGPFSGDPFSEDAPPTVFSDE